MIVSGPLSLLSDEKIYEKRKKTESVGVKCERDPYAKGLNKFAGPTFFVISHIFYLLGEVFGFIKRWYKIKLPGISNGLLIVSDQCF